MRGHPSLFVDGVEAAQDLLVLGDGGHGERRGKSEPLTAGRAPGGEGEQRRGQVRRLGLRSDLRPQPRIRVAVVAAPHDTWPLACGTTGALIGRRPGAAHGHQPRHPAGGVAPRFAGQSGVDHHPHAVHGHGRLRQVGGHDHARPIAGAPARDGPVLLARPHLSVQFEHLRVHP